MQGEIDAVEQAFVARGLGQRAFQFRPGFRGHLARRCRVRRDRMDEAPAFCLGAVEDAADIGPGAALFLGHRVGIVEVAGPVGAQVRTETAKRVRLMHDLPGQDAIGHADSPLIAGTGRAVRGSVANNRSSDFATPITKASS